jgi:uncharacterized protein (TIGR02246 family)
MIRRYLGLVLLGVFGVTFTFDHAVNAWQNDAIVALERGAMDRWGKGDPGGYLELYTSDLTYFDPSQERRVDGLAALTKAFEPIRGKVKIDRYEMIAPKVQRGGTMALLTYNLVVNGRGPDDKAVTNRWNVTAVYTQADGRWKLAHSHFSFTKPELKAP